MTRSDLFRAARAMNQATIQDGDDLRACLRLARLLEEEGWFWNGYTWEQECGPDAEWVAHLAIHDRRWTWRVHVPMGPLDPGRYPPTWQGEHEDAEQALACVGAAMVGDAPIPEPTCGPYLAGPWPMHRAA